MGGAGLRDFGEQSLAVGAGLRRRPAFWAFCMGIYAGKATTVGALVLEERLKGIADWADTFYAFRAELALDLAVSAD